MKFGYTIIYVDDVEKTVNFYQKAFNLDRLFLHESKQYAELNTGETKLAFASNVLAQSNGVEFVKNDLKNHPSGIEIALLSNNVKSSYDHAVSCGAITIKEPTMKPWGQEVAYVRDINGVIIEICSSMSE